MRSGGIASERSRPVQQSQLAVDSVARIQAPANPLDVASLRTAFAKGDDAVKECGMAIRHDAETCALFCLWPT
jgi:hypothetical protein